MSQLDRERKFDQSKFSKDSKLKENESFENLCIMKFGGTSVGTAEMMGRVAEIVESYQRDGRQIVVVTSAIAGVTDQLLLICDSIRNRDFARRNALLERVIELHVQIMKQLSLDGQKEVIEAELEELLYKESSGSLRADIVNEMFVVPHFPELTDTIISYGERLSSRLLAARFRLQGIKAMPIDSSSFVKTSSDFGQAKVLFDHTQSNTQYILAPLIKTQVIPVVTGFIGSTLDGRVTTLGRGGSDYTASVIARAIRAREVWIWTDVDGIYDKNPKTASDAVIIPEMTYETADRMAKEEHKILYQKTIEPLFGTNIVLRVKNTFNPSAVGTKVSSCDIAS